MKPSSINSLMKHMRDRKGIQISGSTQKKKLRYMGYFHGYKGYRYCRYPSNNLPYTSFNELQAVYEFDMKLKTILYPQIMFLETAIKNYVLEVVMEKCNSSRFADVYSNLMDEYKSYNGRDYSTAIKKRMDVRNKIYSVISSNYGHHSLVGHYYDNDRPVPMWAIFELLSLGQFGNLLCCLNRTVKRDISSLVGIKLSVNDDGQLLEKIIFALKDLRNAIAHNNVIFDTRFKTGNINQRIQNYLTAETGINSIDFKTIVDYVILIAFMMQILQCTKTEIMSFIRQFENVCEEFRKNIPFNIYSTIIYTNTKSKLNDLKKIL